MSRSGSWWCSVVFATALAAGTAHANDVLLVPEMQASTEIDPGWARVVQQTVLDVLRDNGFLVYDAPTVRRVAGGVLDVCPNGEQVRCLRDALQSLPARVGMQLTLIASPEGDSTLGVEFFDELQLDPVARLDLPIAQGREQRVALQVAMFALDTIADVGVSSPALLEAARRQIDPAPTTPPPTPTTGDLWSTEDGEDEGLPDPADDALEDEEPVKPVVIEDELMPRMIAGSRAAYDARTVRAEEWYTKRTPHAGRVIIELRGGIGHTDVNRYAVSLGAPDGNGDLTTTVWFEGPTAGVGGRIGAFLGYAPLTFFDFGVMAGAWIAEDTITLGYMANGAAPELGEPATFAVARPYVQPRVRFWFVPTGPVKPYLAAGVELSFVALWKFAAETTEPFQRPNGGMITSPTGALGVGFDPHPNVGILVEGAFQYHLGPLGRNRNGGELLGDPPALSAPVGFTIVPEIALQFRL